MAAAHDLRFTCLDGWRGIGILLVLAAHLLPLGPQAFELNLAAGMLGMVFFFILSGFLVTRILLDHGDTVTFLVRRLFRIVPLAWAFVLLVFLLNDAPAPLWLSHLLFYANLPPQSLLPVTGHLWSLCVEVHFYIGMALLYLMLGRRGLLLLPLLCVGVTLLRIADGQQYSSVTWYRVDEILAGAVLALIYCRPGWERLRRAVGAVPVWLSAPLLLLSCHPAGGFLDYLRPYFAALLVGATLLNGRSALAGALDNRVLAYVASISYALYVWHPLFVYSWLGEGEGIEKYAKRPVLLALVFLVAHISTRSFERPCIAFGKQVERWYRLRNPLLRAEAQR